MSNQNFDLKDVINFFLFQEIWTNFIFYYYWYLYPKIMTLKLVLLASEFFAFYAQGFSGIFILNGSAYVRIAETVYILLTLTKNWSTNCALL